MRRASVSNFKAPKDGFFGGPAAWACVMLAKIKTAERFAPPFVYGFDAFSSR
jgi:hypothetical protein